MNLAKSISPGSRTTIGQGGIDSADRMPKLTGRQKDCLRLVAHGYTSKEIGRRLGISHSTVDNHVLAASQRLGIADRAEAARRLVEHETLHRQQLPRQSEPLASGPAPFEHPGQRSVGDWPGWLARLLPPIGGHENDLPASQRIYAIARVAFFSTLVFVCCAIVIRASFDALR